MTTFATDHLGFLKDANDWREDWSQQQAQSQGLVLSDSDLAIIQAVRDFYFRYELSPAMRPLVKHLKTEFGDDIGNSIYLMQRFGESPARMLALLAGLPKPKNCL